MQSHQFATTSLRCAEAMPLELLDTSATQNWTSLLLNHQQGMGESATFETYRTADLSLTVDAAGRTEVMEFLQGRWRSAIFQPGTVCLTPPGDSARVRLRTTRLQDSFRTIHIYLPGSLVAALAEEYRLIGQSTNEQFSASACRDETLATLATALLRSSRIGAPDLYAAGAAHWMVTHLLSQQEYGRHIADDRRAAATITDRRLAQVIEYMSEHLDQCLTLELLAREAGISVHHFGKRFREKAGMGPAAYLTELRMERARTLLLTTDLAVADIGLRCGYARPDAFSTAFLRQVGLTPTKFRSESENGKRYQGASAMG